MSYEFDFSFLSTYWAEVGYGVLLTLCMTFLSVVPGFVIGVLGAIGKIHGPPWIRYIVNCYVETIRNTPLIIQVFWLFFGLAVLGARIGPFNAAVIALVINVGSYTTEIMRAGLESIPKGQVEAASCLALTRTQSILWIQLPIAIERVYPALVSQFVLMLLATSIMSQISVEELTGVGYMIQSFTFRGFEAYLMIAVIYLALTMLLRSTLMGAAHLIFPRRRRLGTLL